MDRASVTFQTTPQVVTIGLDPVTHALLADLQNMLGTLVGEVRAQRELMERLMPTLEQESLIRQESERMNLALTERLLAPQEGQTLTPGPTSPTGAVNEPTGASTTVPPTAGAAQIVSSDTFDPLTAEWFVQDGEYFIRTAEGQRRATEAERRAIDAPSRAKGTKRANRKR
jgi:hypothetical protein